MTTPKFQNKMQFAEDYAAQIKNATFDDAEDALMELCDYIEPWEDGNHWLELVGDRTISGKPVYFWFTATMMQTGMQLTYHSWAHHY
ncbi:MULTISPECIES: hypothetical protein [Lacticaseibacillus]|jgi:hypothetical protein|uniref:Uncharacterized protein n=3 Tax=Lacticaseibacillus TaxID=2759736 RepID=A0A0R1QRB9_9LACO|nr:MULTISPECIES: hypothetical protein [Lacticaseibacillus]KRL47312.1 hypothetical protein FD01_GL000313 [Lacticaseibacillus manihotivorans DSM 13343 = JCM 12514]QFQ90563.1 hypothetical protein LM010_03550 [Lacticaseibacillus manihotivorans]